MNQENCKTGREIHRVTEQIFSVVSDGEPIGKVELYSNPFHSQNQYLRLRLSRYEPSLARPLFSLLRETVRKPLQVMLSSKDTKQVNFLISGGFLCQHRCYEMEVTAGDYIASGKTASLNVARQGQPEYTACCRLLYDSYQETHAAINPLSTDFAVFCERLPAEALYGKSDGVIRYAAFVKNNEIAYFASADMAGVIPFAKAVVTILFARYETICFECDDCDAAAMALKSLFRSGVQNFWDTYVLDGK